MIEPTSLRVSVVVPTYRRPDLLERCLRALQRQSLPSGSYEIIVCDDGPSLAAAQVVEEAVRALPQGPYILYLKITATQGPAAARNCGWKAARAPVVAFTDDDTVPDEQWLQNGLNAMGPATDAVTGRIVMPLPDAPSDIELDAAGLTRAEFVTANCFIRRNVLEEVGGFDERFRLAWREDSDLHFTLLERGYRLAHSAEALVVHPLRSTRFGAGIGMQKKVLYDVLLYGKHPRLYRERIRRQPPWLYLFISILLVLAGVLALAQRRDLALLALAAWALVTAYFFFLRLTRSAATLRNTAELFVTSLVIPPLSIFWRLVGAARFGVRFP